MPRWPAEVIDDKDASEVAKNLLKGEMAKRNLTYAGLVDVLGRYGIEENERNLRNKISKGAFSASFFFQCVLAMGARSLELETYYETLEEKLENLKIVIKQMDEMK